MDDTITFITIIISLGLVVVLRIGSALASINEVNVCRAQLVLGWVTVSGSIPGARDISR